MTGFQNASITKGVMMVIGVSSLVVSLMDIKPYFHLQLVPHMTKYHQFWRLLVHNLVFGSSAELLLGEILLYGASIPIERAFGPRKFASFVLVSSLVSTIISFTAIIFLHKFGLAYIPSGPYGIIFSLLWQHYRLVPTLYNFRLFGIDFSDKAPTWIQATVLFSTSIPYSAVAAASGLFTGYLYRTDTLLLPSSFRHRCILRPLKTYRIPLSLYNLLVRLFTPMVGSSAPPRRSSRILPGQVSSEGSASGSSVRPSISALLAGRLGNGGLARRPISAETIRAASGRAPATPATATGPATTTAPAAPAAPMAPVPGRASQARQAVGEWVSDLTGRSSGARAPSEDEIATISSMFPNMTREAVVRALQRSDHNTAQAVEALLQENS